MGQALGLRRPLRPPGTLSNLLALGLLTAVGIDAQDFNPEVDADVVLLDVQIVDPISSEPVLNLKADDFIILDEGSLILIIFGCTQPGLVGGEAGHRVVLLMREIKGNGRGSQLRQLVHREQFRSMIGGDLAHATYQGSDTGLQPFNLSRRKRLRI